jgi:hypothetical protein
MLTTGRLPSWAPTIRWVDARRLVPFLLTSSVPADEGPLRRLDGYLCSLEKDLPAVSTACLLSYDPRARDRRLKKNFPSVNRLSPLG